MEKVFQKKLRPADQSWIIINNLSNFDDKPQLIKDILIRIKRIPEHPIMAMFIDIYEEVCNYYSNQSKFPDMAWIRSALCLGQIKYVEDEFSMSIYEDFLSYLDLECLKVDASTLLVESNNITADNLRLLATKLNKYNEANVEIPKLTKDKIVNMYDEYSEDYNGIKTYIKELDDIIGVLGYQSISAFVAPSGHGKSTYATSVAYNTAVFGGNLVDYLSFEVPYQHIWFNLTSMESSYLYSEHDPRRIPSSAIKEAELTDDQKAIQKDCALSLMNKLNKSGGYINIIDQTQIQINTFEGLCAKLESIAEERGRKADLIVVDNVDNLQTLQGSERDETTRVNNYIIQLDSFCKRYCNGQGTHILLLSQVNRPSLKRLQATEDSDKRVTIDVSCVQRFNAIYEKATCVLVGFSNEAMRVARNMNIFPVKLRNRPVPEKPINVPIDFKFSRVGGVEKFIPNNDDNELLSEFDRNPEAFDLEDGESAEEFMESMNLGGTDGAE